ncbi:MAG: sulfate ABC transporter permease subunit [Anaerolineae bacterium]|nr:sulfate ABC transporter permease subunit [Anaerolineae bacterium]
MKERSLSVGGILLLLVVLIYAGTLLLAPVFALVSNVFKDGFDPFWNAITDPEALGTLWLSIRLAVIASIFNAILGIMVAWVLVRHDFWGKNLLNALVDLPLVISPVIVGYVMIVLFGRLGWFKDFPIKLAFSWEGMLVLTVFVSLPFVIREIQPILGGMGKEQEEAAYTLGASPWGTFWRIIFPAIRHGLTYGIVLTLARSLGEFGAVAVIGGGTQGSTESATIYIYRSLNDRNYAGAYSMALLLGIIAILILVIMNNLRVHKRGG